MPFYWTDSTFHISHICFGVYFNGVGMLWLPVLRSIPANVTYDRLTRKIFLFSM